MEQLGELIKALRKANKMTQQALAQQYGMSRATISGIENNTISEIGLRKVENLLKTDTRVVASANPGCTLQMQSLLREHGIELHQPGRCRQPAQRPTGRIG